MGGGDPNPTLWGSSPALQEVLPRWSHLSVPAVTLAHRAQVHADTATVQVVEVAGPLGRSPERQGDASQSARHEAASHVTRRRPALGSVGFGTSFSAQEFTRGTEEFPC